jgi:replication-associated recombination protein RarA
MQRSLTAENVLNAKFNGIEFEGKWAEVIGQPERRHSWIVWGQSGSGKTTFNMQLAKHISLFEQVLYNSMEEGVSASIQEAYRRAGITSRDRVNLVSEGMKDLQTRLERKKSPSVVFIDSIKYTRFRWADYQAFKARFPNKLLIWVGHATGKEPKGALAEDIRYDAFVKIYTEGFRAFVTSRVRTGGESYIDIWPEGAISFHGELHKQNNIGT